MQTNAKLTAKQSVFLTEDRKSAVKEGDPKAKFLLVRAGREIVQSEAEKYEGALDLINGDTKAEKHAKTEVEHPKGKGK